MGGTRALTACEVSTREVAHLSAHPLYLGMPRWLRVGVIPVGRKSLSDHAPW